jgi:hypothetical protein
MPLRHRLNSGTTRHGQNGETYLPLGVPLTDALRSEIVYKSPVLERVHTGHDLFFVGIYAPHADLLAICEALDDPGRRRLGGGGKDRRVVEIYFNKRDGKEDTHVHHSAQSSTRPFSRLVIRIIQADRSNIA